MSEHRVSMLRSALTGHEDPARSKDPLVRAIVTQLATLEAPPMRAHFRAELRSQLVAVAPRLVAEGETIAHQPATSRAARHRRAAAARAQSAPRLRRPLIWVTSTVAALALLLGGAFYASQKALPGDALYGVKRAAENLRMATTSGDTQRAKYALSLASTRITEATDLAPTKTPSKHVASLIVSTLSSADADVRTAAQTLGAEAVRNNSAAPLQVITSWAPGALGRLTKLIDRLPAGAVRDRAIASYQLLTSSLMRAQLLQAEAGCACLHSTPSDQLGPIPCPVCASSANPGVPAGTGGLPTTPGVTNPTGSATAGAPNAGGGSGSGAATDPDPITSPPASKPGLPIPTLPGLPTNLPPLPSVSIAPGLGVGSCGVSISLGQINIVLGTCASQPHS